MSENHGKKQFLYISGAIICAEIVLLLISLKGYSEHIPVTIGPYRQAVFILLTFLAALSLGSAFRPFCKQTAAGSLCIALCVCWFTGKYLLSYRSPDSGLLPLMDQWMPVPILFFGAGAALWAGAFFPDRKFWTVSNDKHRLLLLLLLMFIVLQPILSGGFNWDDAFFSVEAQSMRLTGESIFRRVWQEIIDYIKIGRINPFATFHFLVFYFIPDVRIYKLFLLVLTLINGLLFYRFLRLWTGDSFCAPAVLLTVPLCFQFRLYHDPLNSYYGLMQMMFCELMGALICYLLWLRKGKRRFLVFSLLFFAAGLMSYEMFFPLTALFVILAFEHERKLSGTIRRSLPILLPAVVIFALSMLLRRNITAETAYNGTTFGLDLPLILRTFASQTGAAAPLSYRTAGYDAGIFGKPVFWEQMFNTSLITFLSSVRWQDLLACFILLLVLFTLPDDKTSVSLPRILFGLLLWLLPGVVISLSTKYQAELRPGLAYIPVYFSCFGMALLLFLLCTIIGKAVSYRTGRLVFGGIACAVLLISQQDNRTISEMLRGIFLYPREAGEAALQSGILGETEGKDVTVISTADYSLWEHGWQWEPYQSRFYSLNNRSRVNAFGQADYIEQYRENPPVWITPDNTALIAYSGTAQGGFAKCGRLRGTGFDFDNGTLSTPVVSDVFIFVSGANEKDTVLIYETRDAEWKRLPVTEVWFVKRTKDGVLYKLDENRPILFDTIGLVSN
ncbi:MAG: hypothetical protein IKP86_01050 [Anaerolineaceae bacterium]|nr:hypothetical protein [Anaerolineaceae bacterium]